MPYESLRGDIHLIIVPRDLKGNGFTWWGGGLQPLDRVCTLSFGRTDVAVGPRGRDNGVASGYILARVGPRLKSCLSLIEAKTVAQMREG